MFRNFFLFYWCFQFRFLTLSCRKHIFMSGWVVFKMLNNILICHNQCDKVWSNFVHSYCAYCTVLLCCELLKVRASLCSHSGPTPCPLKSSKSLSFIRQHIPTAHLSQLTNTVPDTARLVYGSNRNWERLKYQYRPMKQAGTVDRKVFCGIL